MKGVSSLLVMHPPTLPLGFCARGREGGRALENKDLSLKNQSIVPPHVISSEERKGFAETNCCN